MIQKMTSEAVSRLGITSPSLLIDTHKAIANIVMMKTKADRSSVRFRPHFKTHQSAAVGEWFRERGIHAITVSSVSMASYFAAHGWEDITIAINVNPLEIDHINELADRIHLQLLVDSSEAICFLEQKLGQEVGVFFKIDPSFRLTECFHQRNIGFDVNIYICKNLSAHVSDSVILINSYL